MNRVLIASGIFIGTIALSYGYAYHCIRKNKEQEPLIDPLVLRLGYIKDELVSLNLRMLEPSELLN